ncbi:hypothetical protein VNO78_16714 [Psophocarpus tetragonolobus]|uniref:Uncharacterized protein n=1 Tax=Psophocarpus tetragonolobus TaxID=3891 RepID=A0AAN9SIN1_PSOTE
MRWLDDKEFSLAHLHVLLSCNKEEEIFIEAEEDFIEVDNDDDDNEDQDEDDDDEDDEKEEEDKEEEDKNFIDDED